MMKCKLINKLEVKPSDLIQAYSRLLLYHLPGIASHFVNYYTRHKTKFIKREDQNNNLKKKYLNKSRNSFF